MQESEAKAGRMTAATPRTYCGFNQSVESFVGLNVRRADTTLARLRGLFGQFRLKSGDGLWIVPSRGLHAVALLAPIDVMYLDAQDRVIHLVEHLSPFRVAPIRLKSSSVLVLPPHTIYSSQTHVGDQLLICAPEEMEAYLAKAVPVLSRRDPDGKGAAVGDAT